MFNLDEDQLKGKSMDDFSGLSRELCEITEAIISKSQTQLEPILEMVYERFKVLDEDIHLEYAPKSLPLVMTNYDRVEQILVILLDNAYKFTSQGGRIEIRINEAHEYISLSVKDTGIGILREDLPFVFDRFYKSGKSRSKKGTGLGLSITKEILTIMGEEITVTSERGQGSVFTFTRHRE